MTPSFEVIDKIISSIKDDSFNGDVMSFLRYEGQVMEEANKIVELNPDGAHAYLTEGVVALNGMIYSLRDDRYGIGKETNFHLEFIEAGLLKIYALYLKLLAEMENPKNGI